MLAPQPDPTRFESYREPLWITLRRTILIAAILAALTALLPLARLTRTPTGFHGACIRAAFFAWFSLGGHWVEIGYLNGLRPRLARLSDRALTWVRLATWVAGGALLLPAALTTHDLLAFGRTPAAPALGAAALLGGPLFVVVELVPHAVLAARGRPSFWNGRG